MEVYSRPKGTTGSKVLRAASRRAVKKRKVHKGFKERDYEYENLADVMQKIRERINLYAIVLDCSGPYFMPGLGKYLCTMKLIDPTLHPRHGAASNRTYLNTTLFANTSGRLPRITKLGSIIRIHRGDTREFEGGVQFNCDVGIKGAWVIFDPIEGNIPISNSGKTCTFMNSDKERLREIREFGKTFFPEYVIPARTLREAEREQQKDFDFLGYILDVKVKYKGPSKIRISDGERVVKMLIPTEQKVEICAQDIVRVRSANFEEDSEFTILTFNPYSSILRVPKYWKNAHELVENIREGKVSEELKEGLKLFLPKTEDVVSSTILNSYGQSDFTPLKELFSESTQTYSKIRVNIFQIQPRETKEWISVVNKKTKETFKLDEIFKKIPDDAELPEGLEYYYKLQFFVKDCMFHKDKNKYILFLCTVNKNHNDYIDIGLGRQRPRKEHFKRLKNLYKLLTRPWVVVDMMVEKVTLGDGTPLFFMIDTKLHF